MNDCSLKFEKVTDILFIQTFISLASLFLATTADTFTSLHSFLLNILTSISKNKTQSQIFITSLTEKTFVFYINVELNKEEVYYINLKHNYVHNTEDFGAAQTYLKTFEKK